MKYVILEHHPNDSRLKIAPDGICQTLSQRMGTGGGNVPLVLVVDDDETADDSERPGWGRDPMGYKGYIAYTSKSDEAP